MRRKTKRCHVDALAPERSPGSDRRPFSRPMPVRRLPFDLATSAAGRPTRRPSQRRMVRRAQPSVDEPYPPPRPRTPRFAAPPPQRTHPPRAPHGPFGALGRAIVYQQLAGRAAQAIHGRLRTAVGEELTPETLAATPDPALRAAGLSANKLASLRDLAAKVLDGTVV